MNYMNIDGVNFLQIQMCLNVVDLGSFTKAAACMHISQPALSRQIASLEQNLGILLFVRGKSTDVRPTPAGLALFAKWRDIIEGFNMALINASEIQACKERSLILSTVPSANLDTVIFPLLDKLEMMYPFLETRVVLLSVEDQKRKLLEGEIDVVLTNPFSNDFFFSDEIQSEFVLKCPWLVGMRACNPLSQQEYIVWDDLRTQQFIVPNSQTFIQRLSSYCKDSGFIPRIGYMTQYFSGLAANVRGADEVFITDYYMQDYGRPGYFYFDLEGTESGLMLAVRKKEQNPKVVDFLNCLKMYADGKDENIGS